MGGNQTHTISKGITSSAGKWMVISAVIMALAAVIVLMVMPRGVSLDTSLVPTRRDCFDMRRETGQLTPECKEILYGSLSSPIVSTAVAVATSDPTAPTPTPKLPIGSRCLNNDQCVTANCETNPAVDGGPSTQIGICGCRARPACLDAQPACALPETPDMCVCGNGQCEIGEKTSCRQDCLGIDEGPSCHSCLEDGFGFLCQGGFTGGTFCGGDPGGPGADYRCVACVDNPTKCVPEGQTCSTNADCGTCGAVCRGTGITASVPPHIIGGKCTYPPTSCSDLKTACGTDKECCSGHCGANPGTPDDSGRSNVCLPKTVAMCDYAAPPEGCTYVPGPNYDPATACGMILKCPDDPSPTPTSGVAYPYVPIDQATCPVCLGQGKKYSCTDVSSPGTLNQRGFCSAAALPLNMSSILTDPVCGFCPSEQDSGMCEEDLKDCGNGIMVGRVKPNCDFAACPTKRDFSLILPPTIRVGDKANLALCVLDQNGRIDASYRGWASVTTDAGPTAEVPTYMSYDFTQQDRGCRVFPIAIQPVREGTLKLIAEDLHFSDIDDVLPTITSVITRTVLPSLTVISGQETCQTCLAKGKSVWCHGGFYAGDVEPTSCSDTLPSNDPFIVDAPSCEVCPTPVPVACVEEQGNVNCDAEVNIADLAQLSDVLLGRATLNVTSTAYKNSDMNKDGRVDIADLAGLANMISGRS